MQSVAVNLFLVLCTIASLTVAQRYHHTHRRSNGLPTGVSGTSGGPFPFPFASGASDSPLASASGTPPIPPGTAPETAPYPAGNGTAGTGAGTGTGTGGPIGTTTRYSTRYITVEESSLSTASASVPAGGESPITKGAAAGPGGATPSNLGESAPGAAPSEAPGTAPSGSPASPSGGLGGLSGTGESTCPGLVTVVVTQDTTVTVTVTAGPSQSPVESKAPLQSKPLIPSTAGSNAAAAVSSSTIDLTSTDVNSVALTQAATIQIPVQQMSVTQVTEPAPTSAPAESASKAAAAASGQSSASVVVSSTDMPAAIPALEATGSATIASSPAAANTTTAAASVVASVAPVSSSGSSSTSSSSLTPNKIKAGVAGYRSITDKTDWNMFTPYIGWYSDYYPDTPASGNVAGIPMLWGNGHLSDRNNDEDEARVQLFQSLYPAKTPDYMLGFYEPDWTPPDSSSIDPKTAAANWTTLLQPLQGKGTKLGSPSMATQYDEKWLTTFGQAAGLFDKDGIPSWDYTVIHTNKPNVSGVIEDINYYLGNYKKPIWVGEFACVDDVNWVPCMDEKQIKEFIQKSVEYFQKNESVIAYGYSNGNGLGSTWPMMDSATGLISTGGQVYLDLIKTYV